MERENHEKILIALLAFISFSCPAFASDWIYLGKSGNGIPTYVDEDSIVRANGKVTGWVKTITPDGKRVLYKISVRESDQSSALVAGVAYDAAGNLIFQHTFSNPEYKPVVPDTMQAVVYDIFIGNA